MCVFSPSFLPTLFLLFHLLDRFVTFMFSFLFHLDLIIFVFTSLFSVSAYVACFLHGLVSYLLMKHLQGAQVWRLCLFSTDQGRNDQHKWPVSMWNRLVPKNCWGQRTADISGILVAMATKSQWLAGADFPHTGNASFSAGVTKLGQLMCLRVSYVKAAEVLVTHKVPFGGLTWSTR